MYYLIIFEFLQPLWSNKPELVQMTIVATIGIASCLEEGVGKNKPVTDCLALLSIVIFVMQINVLRLEIDATHWDNCVLYHNIPAFGGGQVRFVHTAQVLAVFTSLSFFLLSGTDYLIEVLGVHGKGAVRTKLVFKYLTMVFNTMLSVKGIHRSHRGYQLLNANRTGLIPLRRPADIQHADRRQILLEIVVEVPQPPPAVP